MSEIVISCENVSKRYRIGQQERYGTLRDTLASMLTAPVRRLRSTVERAPAPNGHRGPSTFWALNDVSFEVRRGEVVGIIGHNGAGKSTLLKILSRITKPTSGSIELHGRVGSLLEVGTGFHPELSGRENIFLNGAMLGMKQAEIKRKFDEIVAFADVEKFIDTPVKRYSSGMYVRLAFGVAAHLEPEILIVDEVLAVGDAQFQRKCLGKMNDVAKSGRTVLFVSHNMAALRSLCNRGLVLDKGNLILDTDTETAVREYLSDDSAMEAQVVWTETDAPSTPEIRFLKAYILDDEGQYAPVIDCRKDFSIALEYEVLQPISGLRIGFFMRNAEGVGMCGSNDPEAWANLTREPHRYVSRCDFPGYTLNAGKYSVFFGADAPPNSHPSFVTPYCLSFTIEDVEGHGPFKDKLPGVVRPKLKWDVRQLSQS
jgi:lipopolysaccharide transport system ATP-binding protein